MLKDKGANMTLKDNASISNAKIVLNPSTKTMTVIDPAAVNDIQVDGSLWSIVEHTIHADNYINVYTATGAPRNFFSKAFCTLKKSRIFANG